MTDNTFMMAEDVAKELGISKAYDFPLRIQSGTHINSQQFYNFPSATQEQPIPCRTE